MSYFWAGSNKPGVQSDSINQEHPRSLRTFLLVPQSSTQGRNSIMETCGLLGLLTVVLQSMTTRQEASATVPDEH